MRKFATYKWLWMMSWCRRNGLAPSNSWDDASKAYDEHYQDITDAFTFPTTAKIDSDSCICDYCSRKQFPEGEDAAYCTDCTNHIYFLGVQCIAKKYEEE